MLNKANYENWEEERAAFINEAADHQTDSMEYGVCQKVIKSLTAAMEDNRNNIVRIRKNDKPVVICVTRIGHNSGVMCAEYHGYEIETHKYWSAVDGYGWKGSDFDVKRDSYYTGN